MSGFEEVTIGNARLILGDCRDVLPTLPPVSAVVTDPPYGLRFMGRQWDYDVPPTDLWALVLDRLLPGGHLLAFAGTRTQHRMAVRIEDAGFEIRDMIAWVYGSGFPKSHNGEWGGTALKPALEPITVARKALSITESHPCDCKNRHRRPVLIGEIETCPDCYGSGVKRITRAATVAENSATWGTGGLNIDACRVGWPDGKAPEIGTPGWGGPAKKSTAVPGQDGETVERMPPSPLGRWPANLIHDGSDDVVALFPDSAGQSGAVRGTEPSKTGDANCYGEFGRVPFAARGDAGSAARFFYCAKAAASERGAGNDHPTVKPVAMMRWLLTLVTPPGGVVLDPFLGSGSTGVAAADLGVRFVGIERERRYFDIACERIARSQAQGQLLPRDAIQPKDQERLF